MIEDTIGAEASRAGGLALVGDHALARAIADRIRRPGDATEDSDIDILVDLDPAGGNILFRAGGLNEEFRRILGREVDVFSAELLKSRVSETALADAVAL